jgi:tetratricopeptide (TPR) repeat protein
MFFFVFLLFLLSISAGPKCKAQSTGNSAASVASLAERVQQFVREQHWVEVVEAVKDVRDRDAALNFAYGTALAQLGRLDDAKESFLAGRRLAPRDKRFPIELAGVAFKQKRYAEASGWMRRALRIDAGDEYANDFLGTVYFLQNNLAAAVKYWNRVDKPYIEAVGPEHELRIRPALLDRALAFSPASVMRLDELETTRARLDGLEVFGEPRIQLAAKPDGKFDAILNLAERNGFGDGVWEALISTFSGVAYQTVYPEYNNIGGAAINVASLARWDAQKRRLAASLSGPLRGNPKWRYRLALDLRNENWDIRELFAGTSPSLGSLNLRREAGGASIESFNSGRWGWSVGFEFSHRDYRSVVAGSTLTPDLLLAGAQLKQTAGIYSVLMRVPEHRFVLNASAAPQLGQIWSQPAHAFAKVEGGMRAEWFPRAQGDDYAVRSEARSGGTTGQVPFDELFMLGMERDNDLWLRGHVGTRDGRKGSAPLGRDYFLSNNEIDKNVYGNGLVTLKISPFLDTGKMIDDSTTLGSRRWLWDTGVQAKARVLGVGVTFIYGKDLRTGNNAFYFTAGSSARRGYAP